MGAVKILCAQKYGCFLCGKRSYCSYGKTLPYQNGKGEVIMEGLTAKEVLNELKSRFDIELAETEQKSLNKLRDWVRRSIIEGPTVRIGVDGTGGRQGLYSDGLPVELAVILTLKNKHNFSLEDITKAKKYIEEFRNNKLNKKRVQLVDGKQATHIFSDFPFATCANFSPLVARYWLLYITKAKAGYPLDKPATVSIIPSIDADLSTSIQETIEESVTDQVFIFGTLY